MPDCVVIAIRLIRSYQFIAIAAFVAIAAIQLAVVALSMGIVSLMDKDSNYATETVQLSIFEVSALDSDCCDLFVIAIRLILS